MIPRIPESEFEDQETPRICFAPTIQGSLIGAYENKDLTNEMFHVYSITTDDYYIPSLNEVADQNVTGEVWIKYPVKPKYLYDIKIRAIKEYDLQKINDEFFKIPQYEYEVLKTKQNNLNLINVSEGIKKNKFYVRPMIAKDESILLNGLLDLSSEDIELLALDKKTQLIKHYIRTHKHIYVGVFRNKIIGFFRESGRKNNQHMLEEFVIFDDYRGYGFGNKMMDAYVTLFPNSLAKTCTKNTVMIHILEKHGFSKENIGKRIICWSRQEEDI